jgi:hypothetical protein
VVLIRVFVLAAFVACLALGAWPLLRGEATFVVFLG